MGKLLLFSFILLLSAALRVNSQADEVDEDCVQVVYIKTGDKLNAGTNLAGLQFFLFDASDDLNEDVAMRAFASDLVTEKRGIMDDDPKYKYFQRNNTDIFTIKSPCRAYCNMDMIPYVNKTMPASDPGWYIESVKVVTVKNKLGLIDGLLGNQCDVKEFVFKKWFKERLLAGSSKKPPPSIMMDKCGLLKG